MISRRRFLKLAGLAGLSAMVAGCDQSQIKWMFGHATNRELTPLNWQNSPSQQTAAHLLKRLTYGPTPGEIALVTEQVARDGAKAFIETQLMPESIKDDQAYWLTRRIETLKLDAPDIFDLSATEAITDLRRATILRAIYSERQLQEVLVEFWSDHFNIYAAKADCAWLKVIDDREVIRKHAFGKFRDLLRASATSPAMLSYLDGRRNEKGKPNENYARELLELHTLGVDGGYNQQDVMETARALTGWQVKDHLWRGQVKFEPANHDQDSKHLLNHNLDDKHKLDNGLTNRLAEQLNQSDLDEVIEIVSKHPATANFLSKKLCRRFVADNPSPELVQRVARRFSETDGDIRETLRTLLLTEEFLTASPKLKRPYTYAISTLRAIGAQSDGGPALQQHLHEMGQLPFNWPTPNGYPDGEDHWCAQLLPRWNFALALLNREIKGSQVDLNHDFNGVSLATALIQRDLNIQERQAIAAVDDPANQLALLCCLPDFQYH